MFSWENTREGGKLKANPHTVLLGTVYGSAGSITSADPGPGPALRAIHSLDLITAVCLHPACKHIVQLLCAGSPLPGELQSGSNRCVFIDEYSMLTKSQGKALHLMLTAKGARSGTTQP